MPFIVARDALTARPFGATIAVRGRIVRAQDCSVLCESAAVLRVARSEAAARLDRIAQIQEQERARGYAEGKAAAWADQAERIMQASLRVDAYLQGAESQLVDVVVDSMRRIVQDFDDVERACAAVRSALAAVRSAEAIELRVNPADAGAVQQSVHDLATAYPGIRHIEVIRDPGVEPGACTLVCPAGLVHSDTQSQLRAIEAALRQSLEEAAESGS
jgi:type III secretion protein L